LRRQQPGTLRAGTDSRYRGAENQLYRVEVHRSGKAGTPREGGATFKWSRENGSVVFPIKTLKETVATLRNLGRVRRSTLNSGDWVEIVDEQISARQSPGPLAQVEKPPDRDHLRVTLKPAAGVTLPTYEETNKWRPMLRRWDQRGEPAKAGALPITADGWIDLEDGVQISFSKDGDYRAGDYWLIPARTATGEVEWPYAVGSDPKEKRIRAALPPHGVQHHYAPLLLSLPGAAPREGRKNQDCRYRIERLPWTEQTSVLAFDRARA
jgi:hypothetical protein